MAGGTVRIICPNLRCRAILSIPDSARGKSVRCRMCGARVIVPRKKIARQPKVEIEAESESDDSTKVS